MDWFFYILLALINLAGSIAFALLLGKTAKHHEVLPKLLCLLFVVPYTLSFVLYFDLAFSRHLTKFTLTWNNWSFWAFYFCLPQALVLITYLLFSRVISFEQHGHERDKKEKLIGLLSMANSVYNFLFLFLFPLINIITTQLFAYRSYFWQTTGYYIFWAFGLSVLSKHMPHNQHHNS